MFLNAQFNYETNQLVSMNLFENIFTHCLIFMSISHTLQHHKIINYDEIKTLTSKDKV